MQTSLIKSPILAVLLLGLFLIGVRAAPSFVTDFNSGVPANSAIFGTAYVDSTGGVGNSGALKLTDSVGGQQGGFIVNDINSGQPISQFVVQMKLHIGEGTARPADGFSFSFGNDIPDGVIGEDGVGNGIRVTLDTWDNNDPDTAPAIELLVAGVTVAFQAMDGEREGGRAPAGPFVSDPATGAPMTLYNAPGEYSDLIIRLEDGSTVDVVYKGVVVFDNVPTSYIPISGGRFALGARTGSATETHWVDNLRIFLEAKSGTPTILIPPASVTADENDSFTFEVMADGTPLLSYQWLANGGEIPGATGFSLTRTATVDLNGVAFSCRVSNASGSVVSQAAVLTVIADTSPPQVLRVEPQGTYRSVIVEYDELCDYTTATDPFSYRIQDVQGNDVQVMQVQSLDSSNSPTRIVRLETERLEFAADYTVTIAGVLDISENQNALVTTVPFKTLGITPGYALREWYAATAFVPGPSQPDGGLGGVAVSNLVAFAEFPNSPRYSAYISEMSIGATNAGDNFGARVTGFFIPPESGDWRFYLRSDDASQLWLSTDADPGNKLLIAEEVGCCGNFSKIESNPIPLAAGQLYYIEMLMKEGQGADYADAAAKLVSDPTPPDSLGPIPGSELAVLAAPPAGVVITFTQSPVDQTVTENSAATFTAQATVVNPPTGASVTLQWRRDGVIIPGAIGDTYTTPLLTLADQGATYDVLARVPGLEVSSAQAVLTVIQDTNRPTIVNAPVSYCVRYPSNGSASVLFTVFAHGESLNYQWQVDGTNVPSLNHRALKLPLPGIPLPTFQTNVAVTVIVSNESGSTNVSASVELTPAPPEDPTATSAFSSLVVVTNGGTTNLTVSASDSDTIEWRYNGIQLHNVTNVFTIINKTNLILTNIWATPIVDPSLETPTNSPVGLYQAIVRPPTGCANVAWFELEISSRITTNNTPHSVDNLEDFEPLTNAFAQFESPPSPVVRLAAGAATRAGIGILTTPRSKEFQYLSLFASTHQEHEAELFHASDSTNGFSRWFVLRPEDTNRNQLVTLDVSGSANLTNIVLAVYARARPSEALSITNLELITRFDSFSDPTRPPSGGTGTNAVVTFETKTKPEFVVAVDLITNAPDMNVRLNWSTDPFPGMRGFQWLKVLLPGGPGSLLVDSSASSSVVYFAFASPDTNYSSLSRVDADWTAWDPNGRSVVTFYPTNVRELYLLTDPLGGPYQVSVPTNGCTNLAGLSFCFQATGQGDTATAPGTWATSPFLRIIPDGETVIVSWDAEGWVQSGPTVNGPWSTVTNSSRLNRELRLPLHRTNQFYRLLPLGN